MKWIICKVVLALALAPALPASAQGLEEEAARQVALCRDDFQAGHYERAISACDSALRLDPSREVQQEAFTLMGLAFEQLDKLDDARGMFLAFKSLRSGLPDDPEVEAALARLDAAQEREREASTPPPRDPPPRRERTPPKPISEQVLIPVLVTIGGAGASAAGWALHGVSYNNAAPDLLQSQGLYFGTSNDYQTLYDQNKLGLQIGLGGAGVAGAGLVLTLVAASREASRNTSAAAPTVVPWMTAGPGGVVIGIGGAL